MSLDRSLSADEYYAAALQMFDCCGAESTGTLRVDALMDKFVAPFVKTDKNGYSYLKSLLDPDQNNPEISVTMLAKTLHKCRDSQESKLDLDESFNLLKSGQAPHDSDSGISTDECRVLCTPVATGFQLLEELQCELQEKKHLAQQLRSQLEFSDRQHEEALAGLTAERDALRVHLNMLREENVNLTHLRRDYEEVCERLCINDRALEESRRELEAFRRKNKIMLEQVSSLEKENIKLHEQLSKSKAECHHINEMYAARQSALREQNEGLRTEHADLSARLQDQEEFVQQIIREKVTLEMELKDLLNKSNQTHLRMDRSIDISYTEDQMLTALDTLTADSRFSQDNRILDEESFINALKEDQGRNTNISLFDEIRLSFCNRSRLNTTELNFTTSDRQLDSFACDISFIAAGTQTDIELSECVKTAKSLPIETQTDLETYYESDKFENVSIRYMTVEMQTETDIKVTTVRTVETQTETDIKVTTVRTVETQTETDIKVTIVRTDETQTDSTFRADSNNNHSKCLECEKANTYTAKLERDVNMSHRTVSEMRLELNTYEHNLSILEKFVDEGNERNSILQDIIKSLEAKIYLLEDACTKQRERLDGLTQDEFAVKNKRDCSSVSTQASIPCVDCEKRNVVGKHRNLRRFFWTPLKCLFQVFAVLCFICAISVLYSVSTRSRPACPRDAVPWRWMDAQDIIDLLLRLDYPPDVPK